MTVPVGIAPLYLLDTNILVRYVRGDRVQRAIEDTYHLLMTPNPPLISYVTEAEIRSLAVQFGWGQPANEPVGFSACHLPACPYP